MTSAPVPSAASRTPTAASSTVSPAAPVCASPDSSDDASVSLSSVALPVGFEVAVDVPEAVLDGESNRAWQDPREWPRRSGSQWGSRSWAGFPSFRGGPHCGRWPAGRGRTWPVVSPPSEEGPHCGIVEAATLAGSSVHLPSLRGGASVRVLHRADFLHGLPDLPSLREGPHCGWYSKPAGRATRARWALRGGAEDVGDQPAISGLL